LVDGDVLDSESVRRAFRDVDALLHAANVFSLNAADAELMLKSMWTAGGRCCTPLSTAVSILWCTSRPPWHCSRATT
jgi:hypothetical protein